MKKVNLDHQLSLFGDEDFDTTEYAPKPTVVISSTPRGEEEVHYANILHLLHQEKYNHDALFLRLGKSDFRSGFHLKPKDIAYIRSKGMDAIRQHAADFVQKRLAPAYIPNDGKQTPMRGHPVFLAQHATACCCRGCFEKWHHIPAGRALTPQEQAYAVSVLMTWIEKEFHAAESGIK